VVFGRQGCALLSKNTAAMPLVCWSPDATGAEKRLLPPFSKQGAGLTGLLNTTLMWVKNGGN
jgi:hypothetical protein